MIFLIDTEYNIKDTMKGDFCYRHTLLQSTTLSMLLYLF